LSSRCWLHKQKKEGEKIKEMANPSEFHTKCASHKLRRVFICVL
jgi:hypothetical protein